ncbi:MAG: glycosyltransferase family 4 protein [Fimbriiglobus sp.]
MFSPGHPVRRLARKLKRHWFEWQTGETEATFYDLFDLQKLNEAITPLGVSALVPGVAQANESILGAKRFVLTEWATKPSLRKRHPRGLTECASLEQELLTTHGLTADGREHLEAVFAGTRGEEAKRIYDMREDLRDVFLFGITPHPIRINYLQWFVNWGMPHYEVDFESCLWALYEEDSVSDRGLVNIYLSNPAWQKDVPHALTRFGWNDFKAYLRDKYQLAGRWFDQATLTPPLRAWDELAILRRISAEPFPTTPTVSNLRTWLAVARPDFAPDAVWWNELTEDLAAKLHEKPGVNINAHFRYTSGLQEAAVGVGRSLELCGSRTTKRELPVTFRCRWEERERFRDVELFDHTIFLAAVNTFPGEWIKRSGVYWRPDVYRIGYWYWELEQLPDEWHADMNWPDEVWAPTAFLAEAFRKVVTCPVTTMLPGVPMPQFEPRPRQYFGIPQDRYTFVFNFDMGSVAMRKNPFGTVEAFRRAFRPDDRAHLVIKVSRGNTQPKTMAALREAARGANIQIIDQILSRNDVLALLHTADSYVSLHRAEGLGLGMAESMFLGKPVIATGYSGNMDFMTSDTAHLVGYERVPIVDDIPPYPKGAMWAEPNLDDAAAKMRSLYLDPAAGQALGARGKAHVEKVLCPRDFGERMLARLREVKKEPRKG